jgi:DNA helicase IV
VAEAPRDASIAIIAAEAAIDHVRSLVDRPAVAIVPTSLVKGLEYDHVIVVEPAEIVEAEPRGHSRLYVVLTRAVASLVVLHRRPLPAPLR